MSRCGCWATGLAHSRATRPPSLQTAAGNSESSLSTITSAACHSGSLTHSQTTRANGPVRLKGVFYYSQLTGEGTEALRTL